MWRLMDRLREWREIRGWHGQLEMLFTKIRRVVNGKGELAGEFAFGGEGGQTRLLEEDGIPVENGRVDLEKYGIDLGQ